MLIEQIPFSAYSYEFGLVIWLALIFVYILTLISIYFLSSYFIREPVKNRSQTGFISFGLTIPIIGTILGLSGILYPIRDISPFTFAISNLIVALGLFRHRIFNIIPMAHSSVMEFISDPVIVLDAADLILDANPAVEALAGVSAQGLLGIPLGQVFPDFLSGKDADHKRAVQSECEFTHAKGTRWFEVSSTPYNTAIGAYAGRLLILRDITRRKQEETALRSSHDTLEEAVRKRTLELETANRHLLEQIAEKRRVEQDKTVHAHELEILFKLAIDLSELPEETNLELFIAQTLKELTQAFAVSLSDYNPQKKQLESRQLITDNSILNRVNALLGKNVNNLIFPVSEEIYQEMTQTRVGYRKTLAEATFGAIPAGAGEIVQKLFHLDNFIGLVVTDNGELLATLMLILQEGQALPSEQFLYALTHLTTIALKRNKSEKLRRESETRFQQMADLLPQVIYECDLQGQITYTNRHGLELFGFERFEPGFRVIDLVVETQREKVRKAIEALYTGRTLDNHEYTVKRKDGSCIPVLIYSSVIKKENNLAGLRGVIVDISMLKQSELALRESEERYRSVVETSPEGIAISDLQARLIAVNQKDAEMWGFESPQEMVGLSAIDLIALEDRPRAAQNMQKIIDGHKSPSFEYRFLRKDGSYFFGESNAACLHDSSGQVISLVALTKDITERKLAEEAILKLNAELEQRVASRTLALEASNKELEAFSYSVSHDLRAPLRSMSGFSQALSEEYGQLLDTQGQDYLQRIQKSSRTMSELIDDLLNLSRITRVEMTRMEVDLGAIARKISSKLLHAQPDRAVEFIIPGRLLVNADPSLMHIALENLLGNAWKFTSKVAHTRIELGSSIQNGQTVIFIKDNGAGFDMAYVDKLFGAFQRLHPGGEFEGTGIGLSIVQRIFNRHGGQIWAEAAPDQGATFFFTCP